MLVLTIQLGHRVLVAQNIWVTVLKTNMGRAVLGFDAPKDVTILREEVVNLHRDEQAEERR